MQQKTLRPSYRNAIGIHNNGPTFNDATPPRHVWPEPRFTVRQNGAAVFEAFDQFVVKLHSRCNLACDYCSVYELRDTAWRGRPRTMPEPVRNLTARRIGEHARRHGLSDVRVVLHGGEPLLAGPAVIGQFATRVRAELARSGTTAHLVVQSNGLLLGGRMLETLLRHDIAVGVSLDGGPEAHDRHRHRAAARPPGPLPDGPGGPPRRSRRSHRDRAGGPGDPAGATRAPAPAGLSGEPSSNPSAGLPDGLSGAPTTRPRGSHQDVVRALDRLRSPRYRHLFDGLLCAVDTANDPVRCYDALASHDPPTLDFLLPHATWDRPVGGAGRPDAPYGKWLVAAFDRWWETGRGPRVRLFESVVALCEGRGGAGSEVTGPLPAAAVVVEADGSLSWSDALRAVENGAAATGASLFSHSFDDVLALPGVPEYANASLCGQCRRCPIVGVCGGGMRAHRFGRGRGFDNPTVYCADLALLIGHVRGRLAQLRGEVPDAAERRRTTPNDTETAPDQAVHPPTTPFG